MLASLLITLAARHDMNAWENKQKPKDHAKTSAFNNTTMKIQIDRGFYDIRGSKKLILLGGSEQYDVEKRQGDLYLIRPEKNGWGERNYSLVEIHESNINELI